MIINDLYNNKKTAVAEGNNGQDINDPLDPNRMDNRNRSTKRNIQARLGHDERGDARVRAGQPRSTHARHKPQLPESAMDDNAIWSQYGQYNAQDLMQEFPNLSPKDAQTIVNYAEYGWSSSNPQKFRNEVVQRVKMAMGQQGVAEGLDPEKKQRLKDLIDQYRDATDPEAYYGLDDEYPDAEEVIAQIRQEFGDRTADSVEQGPSMHYPRPGHSRGHDPMQYKSSPRITKSGVLNKQDVGSMKRDIKQRLNQDMAEDNTEVPVHRIGLTVTDPNHPMVSKRGETIQKTVRVKGADREKAINSAIAHYRRKGYKVHDHHYIGTVDADPMAEGKKPDSYHIVNKDGKPATLASYADRASAAKDRDAKHPGAEVRQLGPRGKVKNVSEVSLGDYRKKATVNKAVAQANKFFNRDDAAKVAAADQTIAKREKGLARADARVKPYTPPKFDAEKHQRDLTAKYPNIDELVADAEKRRDPYYDRAEGDAYYRGREAEQNYQKLKQIQRVIQGLNESQAAADGPKTKELGTGTGRVNPATGRPWTPSELKAKYKVQATSEPTLDSEPPAPSPEPEPPIPPSPEDIRKVKQLAAARAAQQAMGDVSSPALAPAAVPSGPPGFNAGNLAQLPSMNRFTQQPLVAPKPTANYGPGPAGYKTTTMNIGPTATKPMALASSGKQPTEKQRQEYYKSLGLNEDLSWSQSFNPGRSLYRRMKKES